MVVSNFDNYLQIVLFVSEIDLINNLFDNKIKCIKIFCINTFI